MARYFPLRSKSSPGGLPGLSAADQQTVDEENRRAQAMWRMISVGESEAQASPEPEGGPASVQNTTNSSGAGEPPPEAFEQSTSPAESWGFEHLAPVITLLLEVLKVAKPWHGCLK